MKHAQHLILILIISALAIPFFTKYQTGVKTSINRWVAFSFCDRPIKYRINNIDPKFELSTSALLIATKEATKIWNDPLQKTLFELDDNGSLQVNLVFDERQSIVSTISNLGTAVDQQKQKLITTSEQYNQMKNEIEKEVKNLNEAIDYWNKHGGTSKNDYDKLIQQQKELDARIESLNGFAGQINVNVDKVNQAVHTLNTNVQTFNSLINIHPEEGTYTSGVNKIDIYFYGSHEELVHVLAHEFGHALGLGHIQEKDAIMNPISSKNVTITNADKELLTAFCSNKNRLDLIKNDTLNMIYTLVSKFAPTQTK